MRWVYILRCEDDYYYVGEAKLEQKRVDQIARKLNKHIENNITDITSDNSDILKIKQDKKNKG